jgi:hypothetical protein
MLTGESLVCQYLYQHAGYGVLGWNGQIGFLQSAEYKDLDEPLRDFVKRKGGINRCASRFARRLGRPPPKLILKCGLYIFFLKGNDFRTNGRSIRQLFYMGHAF